MTRSSARGIVGGMSWIIEKVAPEDEPIEYLVVGPYLLCWDLRPEKAHRFLEYEAACLYNEFHLDDCGRIIEL